MEVKKIAERWEKTAKVLKKEDRIYAEKLAEIAKKRSSEAFYAFDDPLEAAIFSVLIEILKAIDVDPIPLERQAFSVKGRLYTFSLICRFGGLTAPPFHVLSMHAFKSLL